MTLRALQERFFAAITAADVADGLRSASPVEAWIVGADEGATRQRLSIYAGAYRGRLVEALGEDYPTVLALLGEDAFRQLALAYLERWPSTNPSLRHLGRSFPSFVREHPLAAPWPWAADLSALEHARTDVFDAEDAATATLDDLARVPASAWPSLCLRTIPALRVLSTAFPVHEAWQALHDGAPVPELARAPTHLFVWRRAFVPHHRAAPAEEARALARLAGGAPLAEVCACFAEEPGDGEGAAARAFRAIAQWVVDEMIGARGEGARPSGTLEGAGAGAPTIRDR